MSDINRVQLGVLPQHSVPDPILFIFRDSQGNPRDLSGPDWSFVAIIKQVTEQPEVRNDPTRFDTAEANEGKVRYEWGVDDLDVADDTKIQMVAQKEVGGTVTRRHISDIAVITVAESPASAHLAGG